MVKYNFPVPRSRGLQNSNCGILVDEQEVCTRDIILHLLLGRIALTDNTTYEIEAHFNTDLNVVEIEIPDHALTILENLGIGPNLQRYLNWLLSGMDVESGTSGGGSDGGGAGGTGTETDVINCRVVTTDYVLTTADSVLVVTSPAIITLPDVTTFANIYGKRFDIKCRTTIIEVVAADGIDDVTSISLVRNENLTVTPTANGWVIL